MTKLSNRNTVSNKSTPSRRVQRKAVSIMSSRVNKQTERSRKNAYSFFSKNIK